MPPHTGAYSGIDSGLKTAISVPYSRRIDGRNAPLVALINETMARKYWPNQDPVGKRFATHPGGPEAQLVRVVGIVGDIRQMA